MKFEPAKLAAQCLGLFVVGMLCSYLVVSYMLSMEAANEAVQLRLKLQEPPKVDVCPYLRRM